MFVIVGSFRVSLSIELGVNEIWGNVLAGL